MGQKSEFAVRAFQEGCNCAQSVLHPFCVDLGLDPGLGLKVASGFGGGMGRTGEVCGAVSGAILAIGLRYGGREKGDRVALEGVCGKTRELILQFKRRHGTVLCRELLHGCDLSTEEGHKVFMERDLRNKTCRPCVETAVALLEELLGG
jgi:C_GCAxxG_C_C family probable redox protein